MPIIEIAINQVICEYFQTNPGPDVHRDWTAEAFTMDEIRKHQKRAALAIHSKLNNISYRHRAAEVYYLVDGAWCNEWK